MRHAAWLIAIAVPTLLGTAAADTSSANSNDTSPHHHGPEYGEVGAAMVVDDDRVAQAKERWGDGLVTFLQIAPAVTVQIFVFAPLPTLWKVYKDKTTGGLPLLPYTMMVCTPFVWGVYGVILADMTIIFANGSMIVMSIIYVLVFLKYRAEDVKPAKILAATALVMVLALVFGLAITDKDTATTVLGVFGGLVMMVLFAGPLTVIRTIIRTKDTSILPFPTAVAAVVNNALWLAFGVVMDDPFIYSPNIINNITAIAQVALFCVYGFPNGGAEGGEGSAEYIVDEYAAPPPSAVLRGAKADELAEKGSSAQPQLASFARIGQPRDTRVDPEVPARSSSGSMRTAAESQDVSPSQRLHHSSSNNTASMRTVGSVTMPKFPRQQREMHTL